MKILVLISHVPDTTARIVTQGESIRLENALNGKGVEPLTK